MLDERFGRLLVLTLLEQQSVDIKKPITPMRDGLFG